MPISLLSWAFVFGFLAQNQGLIDPLTE